jgi:hypothetical protein
MKKLFIILNLALVSIFAQSQIIILEECNTASGATSSEVFADLWLVMHGEIIFDDSCNAIGFDTLIQYNCHQYYNIRAMCKHKQAMQFNELIDNFPVYQSTIRGKGYYEYYKEKLLAKNPTWNPNNIIILK